ncbi:MAG: hypothetical protein SGPRY_006346 [Prymnesium sp.]
MSAVPSTQDPLRAELQAERTKLSAVEAELDLERSAHGATAEMLVEVQQRLEVTLQELANLERFSKKKSSVQATDHNLECLLQEEAYLQSRLSFVKQVYGSPYPEICTLLVECSSLLASVTLEYQELENLSSQLRLVHALFDAQLIMGSCDVVVHIVSYMRALAFCGASATQLSLIVYRASQ